MSFIPSYYTACSAVGQPLIGRKPALLTNGKTCIYAIFGGQGLDEEYFDELREIFTTYLALIEDFIISATDYLQQLARSPNAKELHPKGPDVLSWLNDKDAQPSKEYLISAPVSFPLIGLIQLAHYLIVCRVLGTHPGCLRDCLSGSTGHSQGVVSALRLRFLMGS
jgi:fatty acid synthase subunit beta